LEVSSILTNTSPQLIWSNSLKLLTEIRQAVLFIFGFGFSVYSRCYDWLSSDYDANSVGSYRISIVKQLVEIVNYKSAAQSRTAMLFYAILPLFFCMLYVFLIKAADSNLGKHISISY